MRVIARPEMRPIITQLIDMHAKTQSVLFRRAENFFRFRNVEVTIFAKNIAALGELGLRDSGQHFMNHNRDILLRRFAEFSWDGMSAEACGNEFDRAVCVQFSNDAQQFQLILNRQSVTRFRFDGRGAVLQEPMRVFQRLLQKFIFGRNARLVTVERIPPPRPQSLRRSRL